MIQPLIWTGIEGVILDAVGTLIEPFPPVGEVYLAAGARQGVSLEIREVKHRFHRYFRNDELDETLGPMVTTEEIERNRWRRIVASVLNEVADPDRAFEELWTHFSKPSHWRCFPDVAPALASFRELGLKVRVASNFDGRLRGVAEGLPEFAGLGDSLVISSEVGYRKPHPNFYKAACASMRLDPSAVLSVGDDLENDVEGPARCGLRAILLNRSDDGRPDEAASRDLWELVESFPKRSDAFRSN